MKVDVFPTPFALPQLDLPAWVPELAIPSWAPEPIAQCVRDKYAADVDSVFQAVLKEDGYFDDVPEEFIDQISDDLIRDDMVVRARLSEPDVQDELADRTEDYLRLACDPRMKGVWKELSRQSNGAFLYPACGLSRGAAMLELFQTALACRRKLWAETTTRGEIEQQRDHYLAKARELRFDALTMMCDSASDDWERYQKAKAAAQALEDYARESYARSVATSLEKKHDGRARWVVLTMANAFRTLFGLPMYGQTAMIASVILGRKIEVRVVRHWCDKAPQYALMGPKIGP
jgi:hypothetical protein